MSGPRGTARLGTAFLVAVLLAWLAGCAQLVPQTIALRTGWPEGVPQHVEWTAVPFFAQDDYQCGPAALATVLAYSGVDITPDPLVSQVYLPARRGSLQIEMLAAPRRYGRISYPLAPRYADLLREVAAGNPVLVLQDVGVLFTQWHYAVVNGFDYPSGTVWLRSGTLARQEMPFTYFERTWLKSGYWAMVVVPPDRIPVGWPPCWPWRRRARAMPPPGPMRRHSSAGPTISPRRSAWATNTMRAATWHRPSPFCAAPAGTTPSR